MNVQKLASFFFMIRSSQATEIYLVARAITRALEAVMVYHWVLAKEGLVLARTVLLALEMEKSKNVFHEMRQLYGILEPRISRFFSMMGVCR